MNRDDVRKYTEGGCRRFATCLSRKTGLPLFSLYLLEKNEEGGFTWQWYHDFCKTPEGKIVDVEGIHDPEVFVKSWTKIRTERVPFYGKEYLDYKIEPGLDIEQYISDMVRYWREGIETAMKDVEIFCQIYCLQEIKCDKK